MPNILRSILAAGSISSIPAIRLLGAVASTLLCLHSFSFLVAGERHTWLKLIHNLADIVVFTGLGVSGIVAELFPRDSPTYRLLKAHFPFLVTLIGRGIFYIVLGCLVMGDFSDNGVGRTLWVQGNEGLGFMGYFTVVSGMFILATGLAQLYLAVKNRSARSLQTAELAHPIVAFVPSILERSPPRPVVVDVEPPVPV
jgi:hypothetical protein